jgi:hypothetical protein
MGKKLISFSLWGDGDLYNKGAVANAHVARDIYPDWKCRFYVHYKSPALEDLVHANSEVVVMPDAPGWAPSLWRIYAAGDPDADWIIFRDCDSRLNSKEAAAVSEWTSSGLSAHLMKDTPNHTNSTIMAGMWGIRGGIFPKISSMVDEWVSGQKIFSYGADQTFLETIIWPLIKESVMAHGLDSVTGPGRPFPPHKRIEYGEYVGQVILI